VCALSRHGAFFETSAFERPCGNPIKPFTAVIYECSK
jgi:hypothetical protein